MNTFQSIKSVFFHRKMEGCRFFVSNAKNDIDKITILRYSVTKTMYVKENSFRKLDDPFNSLAKKYVFPVKDL